MANTVITRLSAEGERTRFSEGVSKGSIIFVIIREHDNVSDRAMDRRGTRSCHLTARNGVQFFAAVNVTLHAALERSVVESADSCTSETWL